MFCTVETKRKPLNSLKFRGFHLFAVILRGASGNRTSDTRIFSPLLYQLSYGTIREKRGIPCYRGAKISKKFNTANASCNFVGKFFPARQKTTDPEIRKKSAAQTDSGLNRRDT